MGSEPLCGCIGPDGGEGGRSGPDCDVIGPECSRCRGLYLGRALSFASAVLRDQAHKHKIKCMRSLSLNLSLSLSNARREEINLPSDVQANRMKLNPHPPVLALPPQHLHLCSNP